MAKKRVEAAPVERKNRVMLSFGDDDFEHLTREAKGAKLPTATFARILVLRGLPVAPALRGGSKG